MFGKILIIGGTGSLGKELTKYYLNNSNYEIVQAEKIPLIN